jgi:hypothetical protein
MLAWALSALPAWAQAQSVVLLPPGGDPALAREAEFAHGSVGRALEAQGMRMISQRAAAERAGDDAKECVALKCSVPLLNAVGADLAALVAVRASNDAVSTHVVWVTLMDTRERRYAGHARIELGEIGAAARAALADARAFYALGEGPFVRIVSTPEAAEVWIDGALAGETPYRGALASGRHTVELRSHGYRPHVQTLDMPPSMDLPLEVEVTLAARVAPPPAAIDTEDIELGAEATSAEPVTPESSRPIVGPLLLVVAGAAVVAYDVVLIAGTGCDRREASGACTQEAEVDEAVAIGLAAGGGAAILGGVLWFLLGADEPEPTAPRAALRVSPLGASFVAKF